MICSACGEKVESISRVVIDRDYDRLTTKHEIKYNCRDCYEEKNIEREYRKLNIESENMGEYSRDMFFVGLEKALSLARKIRNIKFKHKVISVDTIDSLVSKFIEFAIHGSDKTMEETALPYIQEFSSIRSPLKIKNN